MARFRLDLEYVGTRYRGWQIQKNARTVQGALHEAVRRVVEPHRLRDLRLGPHRRRRPRSAPGRPPRPRDAASPRSPCAAPSTTSCPPTSTCCASRRSRRQFHARHSAVGRSYLYQIARRRTAFGKPFVWWIRDPLDVPRCRAAARLFEGEHDFRSFSDADPGERSTRVEVEQVEVGEAGDLVLVRVRGSHFLWKMVRRMVGVLAEVGRGTLGARRRRALPARGLPRGRRR